MIKIGSPQILGKFVEESVPRYFSIFTIKPF